MDWEHQNVNGVTLRRPPIGIRVTWGKLPGPIYKPSKLNAEEKKLQRELYNSITPDTVKELGHNEMVVKMRKDYYGHPDAKGMEDKK